MIAASRASRWSLVAHAVDGELGALCGARPRGRWLPSGRLPVNCPRCLVALGGDRLAFCEVPSPVGAQRRLHVRRLGLSGLRLEGGCDTRALCGALPAWDTRDAVTREAVRADRVCASCASAAFSPPLARRR